MFAQTPSWWTRCIATVVGAVVSQVAPRRRGDAMRWSARAHHAPRGWRRGGRRSHRWRQGDPAGRLSDVTASCAHTSLRLNKLCVSGLSSLSGLSVFHYKSRIESTTIYGYSKVEVPPCVPYSDQRRLTWRNLQAKVNRTVAKPEYNKKTRSGECYIHALGKTETGVVRILVIFQHRSMLSHINGKHSLRPFEWYCRT